MIKQIAFLLLVFLILGANVGAAATVTVSGSPTSWQNSNATATVQCTGDCKAGSEKIKIYDANPVTCSFVYSEYQLSSPQTIDANKWVCGAAQDSSIDANYFSLPAEFKVDKQVPTAAFVSPQDGNKLNVITQISGTAQDTGGADLKKVFVGIKNPQGLYWDGASWTGVAATNETIPAGNNWNYAFILPDGNVANNGVYEITVKASDNADNNGSTVVSTFNFDTNKAQLLSAKYISPYKVKMVFTEQITGENATVTITFGNGMTQTSQDPEAVGNVDGGWAMNLFVENGTPMASTTVNLSGLKDLAGNVMQAASQVVVLGEDEAPATTISFTSTGWQASNISISLTCTDVNWADCNTTYYCINSGNDCNAWTGTRYTGTITHSTEGTQYIRYASKDNFGNIEQPTKSQVLKLDKSAPVQPSVNKSISNNDVTISWSGASDSYSGLNCYRVYRSKSSNFGIEDSGVTIVSDCGTGTSVTDYDLSDGTYYYKVRAIDNIGNYVVSDAVPATVNYGNSTACDNDDSAPYLAWEFPASNSTVGVLVNDTAIVKLRVYAYDYECGISFVKFLVDGKPIDTDRTAVNERYTVDWNSETVVDGNHVLKATAGSFNADDTENLTTKTITIKTSNGVTKVYLEEPSDGNKAAAQLVIGSAEDSKESADALVAELASFGALPGEESGALISSASVLLDEAQAFFNDGKYADAKKKANDAKAKFVQAVGMLAVEDYGGTSNYVFNEEHLDIMLKNLGFSQQLRDETKLLLQGNDVNRSLSFRKVNDGDKTYYKAVITLVVKNGSEEAMTVKVVEIVPKELAASASEIAGTEYTVLVDDPVLEWTVSLGAGEEKEIVYALKGELTAEEADDMIASGIINKFAAPPVLFKGTTNVEAMFLPALAGLFGLGGAVETVGVAIIIGAIIVFAVLYVAGRNRGRGNEGSALDAAASRAGFGSGFFGRLGGKEEPSKPKWGYKGI